MNAGTPTAASKVRRPAGANPARCGC
jgi:hypothetical protein